MTEADYARALEIDGAKCNIRFWRKIGDDTKADMWRSRLNRITGKARPDGEHPMTAVRNENREAVFAALQGQMTTKQIQDATGLSRPSIYAMTSELIEEGRIDVIYRSGMRYWFRTGGAA